MTIKYEKISLEALESIAFFHYNFDFLCDGDRKVIYLEKNEE